MIRLLRPLLVAGCLYAVCLPGRAFTLLGPPATWMTHQMGYDVSAPLGDYGPMNLGEEYRWNVPTLYYAFTSDFLNYFGDYGAKEIDKALQMLNNLPPVSMLNIDDYPAGSIRINHRAQALGLTDLKSFALREMVYMMGVGDPTRYVFCLRNRWTPGSCPPILYHVIQRSLDPDTLQYSPYINGDLWTYTTIIDTCTPPPDYAFLAPEPVDPMALLGFRHLPASSYFAAGSVNGGYATTLTRDDVAALQYIYRTNNYNVETIPPGVTGGTNMNFIGTNYIGSLVPDPVNPWGIPAWLTTNGYTTNAYGTNIYGGGEPWGDPSILTNYYTNIVITNDLTLTNAFIEPALRAGIDKVTWQRLDYDSILGNFFTPVTNLYTERVIVNGKRIKQRIERVIQVPDIIFDAADLQGGENTDTVIISGQVLVAWQNNDAINGLANQIGPGTMVPSVGATPSLVLVFNSVGPIWGNQWPNFLSQADAIEPNQFLLWGSYDGSTNTPVVYPFGTSIEAIEAEVLKKRR